MQDLEKLLADKAGLRLDVGCGQQKQSPAWVGLDIRDYPGVTDILWDVNQHPWPLPDECVLMAVCSHLIEHIPPIMYMDGKWRFLFLEFMDEVWRVMKPDGEFAIAMPHGYGQFYIQDPTHCNPCNETTWAYFDPLEPKTGGALYKFYRVKPWRIKALSWDPAQNMEVVLVKRRWDVSYGE